jgi:hypothetical protein
MVVSIYHRLTRLQEGIIASCLLHVGRPNAQRSAIQFAATGQRTGGITVLQVSDGSEETRKNQGR